MITMKRISAATLLAVASLTYSPESSALGLGDATVESFLNQPLQLRIDLITRESDDLASVTAKMASADDYELIGASLESVPVPIRFALEDLEGDAHIVATSSLPVNEPVVRLIVEVNWSSGRLLREYTIFLDPATVPEQAPLPRTDRRAEAAPAAQPAVPATRPAAEPASVADQPAAVTPARQPQTGEYGPVRSGETLWRIASDWSDGTGLDINKVMIAIQRENPQAFMNDNINLLKRGAILRMPAVEQVDEIPVAAAINEVSAQTDAFRNRRQVADAASPATPLLAEERAPEPAAPAAESAVAASAEDAGPDAASDSAEPTTEESAQTEPVADAEAAADDASLTDQLELVPPSADSELDSVYGFEETDEDTAGADASMAVSALREDLARTEEELVSQQQQNTYLQERIQELESQLAAQAQDGMADADLANMEDRLRAQREATPAPASEPWYSRISYWLIGLLVVVAGFVGWMFSRRGGGEAAREIAASQELRGIQDEAEAVLRVLDEPEKPAVAEQEPEPPAEEAVEAAPEEAEEPAPETTIRRGEADAELLDEESSDPEIQLDLARAYISMGDKEAARVILEEVVANGSEEQQAEAQKMLELLAS